MGDDDEAARRERAARIREQIAAEREGASRPPRTPRDFTERAAREAAEEAERRPEDRDDDPPADAGER
jgi:hypothetical protein